MENCPMNYTSSRACRIRPRQSQGGQGCSSSCPEASSRNSAWDNPSRSGDSRGGCSCSQDLRSGENRQGSVCGNHSHSREARQGCSCNQDLRSGKSCRESSRGNTSRMGEVRRGCSCGGDRYEDQGIYVHADQLPLTMAYVPMQRFGTTFPLCKGFQLGTIFPDLCKPFCGRRCASR